MVRSGMTSLSGRMGSGDALQEASSENAQFVADGESYLVAEDVVLALGDFFQELAVNVYQHPQGGLAVFRDVGNQLVAGQIEFAGTVGFERQQRAEARGDRSRE